MRFVRIALALGSLALMLVATPTSTFAFTPPVDGGVGNCESGAVKIYTYINEDYLGKSLTACSGSDLPNLIVTPWDDGTFSNDNPNTSEDEDGTNDQISSFVIQAPDRDHCAGSGVATITLFAHRAGTPDRYPSLFVVPNNGGRTFHHSMTFMGATDTRPDWDNEVSGISVHCGY